MPRRSYKGNATQTTLSANINSSVTSISVADGSSYPDGSAGPFFVVLDKGQVGEEKILVTTRVGNTFTVVTRGQDDTTATTHSSGGTVNHCFTKTDADEANAHINTGTAVHGLAGDVVGTTDSQTLSNKSLTSPVITGTANASTAALLLPQGTTPAQTAEGSVFWDTDDDLLTVGTGTVRKTMVDTSSTQTLGNKTLSNPSISNAVLAGNLTGTADFSAATALVLPVAAAPAQTTEGSVVWDSDDDLLTVGTGAARKTMMDLSAAQTVTGVKTFTANPVALNIPVVCTSSTRPGSPVNGQLAFETDTGRLIGYENGGWKILSNPELVTYTTTLQSSGPTSGTAETTLAQVGVVHANVGDHAILSFSWYNITQTVSTDVFLLRFYNQTSSTLLNEYLLPTGANCFGGTFMSDAVVGAATTTFDVRLVRSSGTGTATLVQNGATRVPVMTVRPASS